MARTRSADRADAGESRVNCVELFQAGSKTGRNARFFVLKILYCGEIGHHCEADPLAGTPLSLFLRLHLRKEGTDHKVYEHTYFRRKVFTGWPEQPERALMINIFIQYA